MHMFFKESKKLHIFISIRIYIYVLVELDMYVPVCYNFVLVYIITCIINTICDVHLHPVQNLQ